MLLIKNLSGSEISYFGNNNLSLPQFRLGSNDSKNHSEHSSDRKKMRITFFRRQRILEKDLTYDLKFFRKIRL